MIQDAAKLSIEKALMDGIQEMVFIVRLDDGKMIYEFVNQSAMKKTELDQSAIGKTFYEVQSYELADRVHSQYLKVLESGCSAIYEDSYVDPEGNIRHSKTRLTPMFNMEGDCTHIVSIVQDITNEMQAKQESIDAWKSLEESRSYYHSLFEHNADAILTLDLKGHIKGANPVGQKLSQHPMEELNGRRVLDFVVPEDRRRTLKNFRKAKNGIYTNFRVTIIQKNNNRLGALVKFIPIKIREVTTGFYVILKDMRELDQMVELYMESEKNFRIIAENANDVIILINHRQEYLYISPSLKNIFGYSPGEYEGKEPFHNVHPEDLEKLYGTLSASIKNGSICKMRVRVGHIDGHWIWSELHGTPVFDDEEKYSHMVMIVRDVSLQKDYETKLEFYAYHDPLTGLPNRRYFQETLEKALADYHEKGDNFAVLLLDIDKFKGINDKWGHEIGDAVIREFGKRLTAGIYKEDLAARLGGDEFIILLPGVDSVKSGVLVMNKIRQAMMSEWKLDDIVLSVSTSIGMTMPNENSTLSSILKEADKAMYEEKNLKKRDTVMDRL
ncbi:diguanylate cyclase domain-containing protein [Planococcus halotolerans]|uniref:Sensor domain-containing diguanylate cyclase n=1 Tax=Planococcus halotolerans TaxID=2233542 RepID=A0A365L2H5_9BACL|nr:diguanylate cyclase [Planococcus halotolerans]RAZ79573.1 sensor domain-containing diguanylate cyclase [Planococcus halotolerans]